MGCGGRSFNVPFVGNLPIGGGFNLNQALNWTTAVGEWTLAGQPVRDMEVVAWLYRQVCAVCPYISADKTRCTVCGCQLSPTEERAWFNKLRMETQRCPQNRWPTDAQVKRYISGEEEYEMPTSDTHVVRVISELPVSLPEVPGVYWARCRLRVPSPPRFTQDGVPIMSDEVSYVEPPTWNALVVISRGPVESTISGILSLGGGRLMAQDIVKFGPKIEVPEVS